MCEALRGLHVIDFGTFIAGPLVARLLGDAGAECTRVVQPGHEDMQAYADPGEVLTRNKATRCLDLKTPDGRAAAWELLSDADVLVENFRPGVMAKLGFGRDAVLERFPNLVYLSLPGYSSDDPERRELRAFDASIMAECGVFSDMGLNRVLMGVNPSFSTLAMASTYSAVLAAYSAVLALLARETSGKGEAVEVRRHHRHLTHTPQLSLFSSLTRCRCVAALLRCCVAARCRWRRGCARPSSTIAWRCRTYPSATSDFATSR